MQGRIQDFQIEGAKKMCARIAHPKRSLPLGSRAHLRALEPHAIWALFWIILIQNWILKRRSKFRGARACCAPAWIRHWSAWYASITCTFLLLVQNSRPRSWVYRMPSSLKFIYCLILGLYCILHLRHSSSLSSEEALKCFDPLYTNPQRWWFFSSNNRRSKLYRTSVFCRYGPFLSSVYPEDPLGPIAIQVRAWISAD